VNEKKVIKYIILSSFGSGTVINYGSGSDFLTSYGSGSGSGSTSQKVTVPTVPFPVPPRWREGKSSAALSRIYHLGDCILDF
jgi:hypothetical protein